MWRRAATSRLCRWSTPLRPVKPPSNPLNISSQIPIPNPPPNRSCYSTPLPYTTASASTQSDSEPKSTRLTESTQYFELYKRQMKIETEAWEQAAREYRNLVDEMCRKKMAPNLPYVKKLMVGWFEPLKEAIAEEQERCKEINAGKWNTHAPYFNLLKAEKAAVITMHTVMGMLMGGAGDKEMGTGVVTVREAALGVGEAFETEVRIERQLAERSGGGKGSEDGLMRKVMYYSRTEKKDGQEEGVGDVPENECVRNEQKNAQVIHCML